MAEWVSAHFVGQTDPVSPAGHGDAGLLALALAVARPAWMADAECSRTDVDPSIFFPELGETGQKAKAICERCPVTAECLEEALATDWRTEGVWGGTSLTEREQIMRERRAAA